MYHICVILCLVVSSLSVYSVTKQFRLDYFFEEEQVLRFDVFDEDKKGSSKLKDHDILGSCTMVVGEIVHEPGNIYYPNIECKDDQHCHRIICAKYGLSKTTNKE